MNHILLLLFFGLGYSIYFTNKIFKMNKILTLFVYVIILFLVWIIGYSKMPVGLVIFLCVWSIICLSTAIYLGILENKRKTRQTTIQNTEVIKSDKAIVIANESDKAFFECMVLISQACVNGEYHIYYSNGHINDKSLNRLRELGYTVSCSQHQSHISWTKT